ncbi:MAG: chloride channel protein [Chitinophagales bacterium]
MKSIKTILLKIEQHQYFIALRNYIKKLYDSTIETNSKLKIQFLQFFPFIIASFLIGIIAYAYSVLFNYATKLSFSIYDKNPLLIFIITPIAFLISWWLVQQFAPYAKGSGIPQVMTTLELTSHSKQNKISYLLSAKIALIKIISSVIKVIGGGVIGREGPTIHIASAISNLVYKLLPKWWIHINQKNMIIAGAASGLSAAFNTPLGGIIFAIEELSKYHMKYYKSTLFIAVIIAGLTAQGLGGPYLYLGYPKTAFDNYMVYIGILIVAILSGFFGAKVCDALLSFIKYFNSNKENWRKILLIIVSSLIVATMIYFYGTNAMGSGKEYMEKALFDSNKTIPWQLPFIRMAGMIASFGSGGAGGVFAPSLSCGASIGAIVADWLQLTHGNANLIILVGMVGFLTAVTRAPFTAAIIVFEMTDRHSIIFFLLLGAMIANFIAYLNNKHSFYHTLYVQYLRDVESKAKKQ